MLDGQIVRVATEDMEVGTIIHAVVGEGKTPPYHVLPKTYGKNKKWHGGAAECKSWVATHADLPILEEETVQMVNAVAAEARSDKRLMKLIDGAASEVTACAYNQNLDQPYLLRCRFDKLKRDEQGWLFVDWKSTRDASTEAFSWEILKRGHHAQMAFYRRILRRLTGEKNVRCYLVALEKSAKLPRINVRQLANAALDAGDKIVDARLSLLRRCRLANRWPALPDDEGSDTIDFIDLPEGTNDADAEISAS